jgi:hypothetical protein
MAAGVSVGSDDLTTWWPWRRVLALGHVTRLFASRIENIFDG